jgi:hypothetical protein
MHLRTAGLIALLIFGCGKSDSGKKQVEPEPESATAPTKSSEPSMVSNTEGKMVAASDSWVPKEHTSGIKKFKDPGVYVDGVVKGILKFGELPLSMKPVWFEEEAAVPFKKGDNGPRSKIVKQRRYRWADYFKGLGIDLAKVKEMHIYGGAKRPVAVIIKGDMLRKHADDFQFRFGSDVYGKAIPACPGDIADGNCPDNIRAIALYIERTPPIRKRGYFYLNGERLTDIPYYGSPLRGGVRVYFDGPLVAHIKRHKLKEAGDELKAKTADGSAGIKFFEFLKTQGVDTGSVKEAWLVHKNQFVKRIERAELAEAVFIAGERRGGEILFGNDKIPTNVVALSSERIAASDIPKPEPHEIH